jgi:hypothetical protein
MHLTLAATATANSIQLTIVLGDSNRRGVLIYANAEINSNLTSDDT